MPRGATNRMAVRRFSAEPTTIPAVMFTSTASIQLSKASRVSRGGVALDGGGGGGGGGGVGSTASLSRVGALRQAPPMQTSGEMYFDEDFSVQFDANLIVGTPLEEDSLQQNAARLGVSETSNLRMVNSRSDGCLFYPEEAAAEAAVRGGDGVAGAGDGGGGALSSLVSVQTTSGPSQNLTGVSVTSNSSDRLTGVSNLEDNCSWTESQGGYTVSHRSMRFMVCVVCG